MPIILITTSLLALLLISSVWFTARRKEQASELRRSNARVLREYKRIAQHRPHWIIDNPNRRNNGIPRNPNTED